MDKKKEATQVKDVKRPREKKFTFSMQKKLVVLFVLILLAFAGLCVRLIWLTQEKGTQYTKQILSQQAYDSTTLPFRRGDIVDSNGIKLAVSEKVYNLVIDAKVMLYREDYYEPTIKALEINFPELDINAVKAHVRDNKESSYYIPVKKDSTDKMKQLTYEQISGFKAAAAENSKIRGVWFEEEYKRVYPMGSLACDVIGFTGKDNVGFNGLEEFYNEVLNGTTGREFGYLTEDTTLERTIKPAVDGYTIHSTIDANIQSVIEKYLKQFNEEHKNTVRTGNGAENVGCIIQDIDTGNILGMASYPFYDLNDTWNEEMLIGNVMVNEVGRRTGNYITQAALDAMDSETRSLQFNHLWKNFCISDTYEPGSTAKPFTVAMALETGSITGNEVYTCNGSLQRGGHTIRCHTRSGDGAVTVQNSIAWSCNVALMYMAEAVGKSDFSEFQEIFNFGLKTNVDLAGEARTVGLLYDENMGDADLATNSFGQNFNVTMIQMISGFSSLINGGYYYEPHLVDKITTSNGAVVQNIEPRVLKRTVSESTSENLIEYCTATVMETGGDRRTGKTARPAGYAIGGKTGTAQTLPRGNGEYVVSFMGFAPAEDPQIAIYVVVDRPNATKQDDAKFATGIVRNVLTEVLPYLNIYMTEDLSEKEIAELEERQLAITNQYGSADVEEEIEDVQTDGADTEEPNAGNPLWMSYEKDPATGYLIDPETKELLDPDTGWPVNTDYPALTE